MKDYLPQIQKPDITLRNLRSLYTERFQGHAGFGYAIDACPHEIDSSGIWRRYQKLCYQTAKDVSPVNKVTREMSEIRYIRSLLTNLASCLLLLASIILAELCSAIIYFLVSSTTSASTTSSFFSSACASAAPGAPPAAPGWAAPALA